MRDYVQRKKEDTIGPRSSEAESTLVCEIYVYIKSVIIHRISEALLSE